MKMPTKPPRGMPPTERIFDLVERQSELGVGPEGRYLHWDELRRRPPPLGLSSEDWWWAVKVARRTQLRSVPLTDTGGTPFRYGLPDSISRDLHQIDLGAGGSVASPVAVLNEASRDRYYFASLVEEAVTSSIIEGAVTTRDKAKQMLRDQRPPRDKSERMVLNNFRTVERLRDLKNEPLTPDLVHEIHRMITLDTLDDPADAGRPRGADRHVVIDDEYGAIFHVPPPAEQLERRMQLMCDFANAQGEEPFLHPVVRGVLLHFWLAYDHPYVDGNGRTARSLFYWSMLRHGYWLFEYISISSSILKSLKQYYRAYLYTETDDNDLTYFLLYHFKIIRHAIDGMHRYIEQKSREVQSVDRIIQASNTLNHRQRALLSHALRHPGERYTARSHQSSHRIADQTARNDLLDLQARGLLESSKIGRTHHFTATGDLQERMGRVEG